MNAKIHQDTMSYYSTLFQKYSVDDALLIDRTKKRAIGAVLEQLDKKVVKVHDTLDKPRLKRLRKAFSNDKWFKNLAASLTFATAIALFQAPPLEAKTTLPLISKAQSSFAVANIDEDSSAQALNNSDDVNLNKEIKTTSLHLVSNKAQYNDYKPLHVNSVLLDDDSDVIHMPQRETKSLTVIDTTIEDWQTLAFGVKKGAILLLKKDDNALDAMLNELAKIGKVDALNIISHGSSGQLHFSDKTISTESLQANKAKWEKLGSYLSKDGDILLYGCNVAQDEQGKEFIKELAELTSADVAASINPTGNSEKGGDWKLETVMGKLENSDFLSNNNFLGLLGSVTFSFDSASGNNTNIAQETVSGYTLKFKTDTQFYVGGGYIGGISPYSTYMDFYLSSGSNFSLTNMYIFIGNGGVADGLTFTPYVGGSAGSSQTIGPEYNSNAKFTPSGTAFNNITKVRISQTPGADASNPSDDKIQSWLKGITLDISSNTAPTITGASAGQAVNDTATLTPFSGITLADTDGDNISMTITLDTNAKGVLSGTGLSGTGPYTIASDTVANVQAKLRALSFNPTDNRVAPASTETTTFSLVANDGTADSTTNSTTTVVSTSINDAPTDIALSSTSVNQSGGTNATVGTLSDTDADTGDTATYTLVAGTGDTNNGSFNISTTALRANDSSALSAGTYNIRVNVNDGDADFAKAFTITVVDDVLPTASTLSPILNATGVSTTSNLVLTFSENIAKGTGNIVIKAYSNDAVLQTIDVTSGAVVVSGTTATITHSTPFALNTQYYVTVDATAFDDIAVNSFAGIANKDTWKFTSVANNVPVNTLPSAPTVKEDDGSVAIADTINIADADSDNQSVTLTATNGTISLTASGATITTGDGTDDAVIAFNGTLANVNTALDSLTFKPTANFSGNATLRMQTSDGNGGTDDDTLTIPVANAPEVTSINRLTPSASDTNADTLIFRVTFSESVSGIDSADFSVNGSTATVTNVSAATGTTTDVTVSGGDLASLNATVRLDITDDNTIINSSSVALGGSGTDNYTAGQTYAVDNAASTTTINTIDISADTGSSATDFLTKTAAQTITATLSTTLAAGEILYGSVDAGSTWTDITSKVTATAISWDGVTLSGTSSIKFKVTDAAGNDGTIASQAYTLDTTAPTLSTLSPTDNATSIAVDANLVITLTKDAVKGSGNIVIYNSANTAIETIPIGDARVSISGAAVTINPTANLSFNTAYYVQIAATALTDTAGNPYAGITDTTSWSFTTTATDADATLTASATVNESSMIAIPTAAKTVGAKVNVFDFTITDAGTSDGLPTDVTQIVLHTSGTADFSKMVWHLNGPDATDVVGVYSSGASTLTFTTTISVTNAASETYTLSGYFSDATGLTDNATFSLSVDGDTDITVDSAKTGMAAGQSPITNNTNAKVDVTATKLIFVNQPSNVGAL